MVDTHELLVRVYFEDTDFSGNVYHASYLKFFERGRTEWLRELGIFHSKLAKDGLVFAVRKMEIAFEAAAGIDDELQVLTKVKTVSGARIILEQHIMRDAQLLTKAEVMIIVMNDKGRATRLPKEMLALFPDA